MFDPNLDHLTYLFPRQYGILFYIIAQDITCNCFIRPAFRSLFDRLVRRDHVFVGPRAYSIDISYGGPLPKDHILFETRFVPIGPGFQTWYVRVMTIQCVQEE